MIMSGPRVAPEERIIPGRLARHFFFRGMLLRGGDNGYVLFIEK